MQKIYKGGALALMVVASMMSGYAQTSVSPTGSNLYGFLGYCSPEVQTNGWYSITPDGEMTMLWPDLKIGVTGSYFNIGWIDHNALCGIYGNNTKMFYLEFDINTGEPTVETEVDIAGENMYKYMLTGCYNPDDQYIYGFSFNADRSLDYFVKAPASDISKVEIIRQMPADFVMCKSLCYNITDQHFYGIDTMDGIVRFDTFGNFSYIKDVNMTEPMASFASAMIYSPKDKAYFWDAQYATFDSSWVRIDPETFACEVKRDFPFLDLITILATTDDDGMAQGPVAPVLKNYGIEGAANSGKLVYTMPSAMADGSAAPSELTWTATVLPSGESKSGTAAPGSEVTVDYSDLSNGEHTFSFYASAGENRGASVFKNAWIGLDVPYVPEDVVLKEKAGGILQVTWNPVTHGAHNGTIDLANMSYAVFINGEQKLVTKECTAEIPFDAESSNAEYTALVVAICDGLQSEAGQSNSIVAGKGYALPYEILPTLEQIPLMTYINVDNDMAGWRFKVDDGYNTFFTDRDHDNPGNDWLITPKLVFPSDADIYTISFEASAHSGIYNEEFFEVWLGIDNTIEGIADQRLVSRTPVTLQSFEPFKFDFTIDQAGSYYIGIRSVSNADQGGWYIKNISITRDNSGAEEHLVESVSATGAKGEILLCGLEGENVEVYKADGTRTASMTAASASESVKAEAGIYVVKAAGKSWKVVVK